MTDKNKTQEMAADGPNCPAPIGSALRMPRWKMMDVVWLHRRWNPRALIVGIIRDREDPNEIRYDVITETLGNGSEPESYVMTREEWLEGMEPLRDEISPKEWCDRTAFLDEPFEEPKDWAGFRQRWKETGDPFEPWEDGSHPTWQIDQTFPQNK